MENLTKFYKNKKILITGVTGFKGAWLAKWLIELKANVIGIGNNPNQNKKLFYELKLHKKVKTKIFDVRDFKKLKKLVINEKPSIIFHLAAQPLIYESYQYPYKTVDTNIRGTLNILEISRLQQCVKSLVIVTSDKCYESNNSPVGFKENDRLGGVDPYSASKASAEIISRAYRKSFFNVKKKMGISTGRAGNVIGGGDWSTKRLIPDCIRSIMKNKTIMLRNPNFNRPWQHVLEPLKGYLILAKKQFINPKKYSSAWNFGTNPNSLTDVKTITEYLIKYWGSGKLKVRKKNFYEQVNLQLNIRKAKKILNWKPTYNIEKSVKITTEWYYRVLKLKENVNKVTSDQILNYMKDSKIK